MRKESEPVKINSVLITEASQKNSLGIARSLGEKGKKVFLLAGNKTDQTRFSKHCSGSLTLKKLDIVKITNFIKTKNIDLVIPVGTTSIKFFAKNHLHFSKITRLFIPSYEGVELCMSKKKTHLLAQKLNIPTPKTFFPSSLNEAKKISKIIEFPCVIKWPIEVGDNIVDYANDKNDFWIKYKKMIEYGNQTYPMVQEFIEGDGVGYFALFKDGKEVCSYQHKRLRESPPSGGVSVCAKTVHFKDAEIYGNKLLSHLNWNGVAMVEFKMLKDKSFVLMEINPKFWGSHDLGIASGVNFPLLIIKLLETNENIKINSTFKCKIGTKFHWPIEGDLKYIFYSFERFVAVVFDLINPFVKSNLKLFSDPLPTIVNVTLNIRISILKLLRLVK